MAFATPINRKREKTATPSFRAAKSKSDQRIDRDYTKLVEEQKGGLAPPDVGPDDLLDVAKIALTGGAAILASPKRILKAQALAQALPKLLKTKSDMYDWLIKKEGKKKADEFVKQGLIVPNHKAQAYGFRKMVEAPSEAYKNARSVLPERLGDTAGVYHHSGDIRFDPHTMYQFKNRDTNTITHELTHAAQFSPGYEEHSNVIGKYHNKVRSWHPGNQYIDRPGEVQARAVAALYPKTGQFKTALSETGEFLRDSYYENDVADIRDLLSDIKDMHKRNLKADYQKGLLDRLLRNVQERAKDRYGD